MIGRWQDYPAVVPYLTCGWPDPEGFLEAVMGAADAGCPFFEVGFPFSDPIADGPVIQRSSAEALANGITVERCFELTEQAIAKSGRPALCMTYANLVFHLGLDRFAERLAQAGGKGLIVADLSFEESPPVAEACRRFGLELVSFLAPTTAPERRRLVAAQAEAFLYLVAARGVTGGRSALTEELGELIAQARQASEAPVLVGFGIRGPQQVQELIGAGAHGVIVGTALIEVIGEARSEGRPLRSAVADFLRPLTEAAEALK